MKHQRPRITHLTAWSALALGALLSLATPTLAQDAPAPEALSSGQGTLVFESLPPHLDNPGGSSFYWRTPVIPQPPLGALPLEQLQVVLIAAKESGNKVVHSEIKIHGYGASPKTTVVSPGGKVRFLNQDAVSYTLEIEGRRMDPVAVGGKGSQVELTLEKPGRYVFRDPQYTSVTSYVIVTKVASFFALRAHGDKEALFQVDNLPPGKYRMEVYFRGEPLSSMTREIQIQANGTLEPARFLVTSQDFQDVEIR